MTQEKQYRFGGQAMILVVCTGPKAQTNTDHTHVNDGTMFGTNSLTVRKTWLWARGRCAFAITVQEERRMQHNEFTWISEDSRTWRRNPHYAQKTHRFRRLAKMSGRGTCSLRVGCVRALGSDKADELAMPGSIQNEATG